MVPINGLEYVFRLYELLRRLYCLFWMPKFEGKPMLTSIPERSEIEEDLNAVTKWVPKQKHEVLKAKYKCLKKLFQVYDASLINMLPPPYARDQDATPRSGRHDQERSRSQSRKKRRRTHRRSADASAAPGERSDADSCLCAATALLQQLRLQRCAPGPTLLEQVASKHQPNVSTIQAEAEELSSDTSAATACSPETCGNRVARVQCLDTGYTPLPKLTRMQIFKYRLFGRTPKQYRNLMQQSQPHGFEPVFIQDEAYGGGYRPRPRHLRLRRGRAGQARSCAVLGALEDAGLPRRMRSAESACLLDTTPRCCPYPGCNMTLNGIINYNDHLRLCHQPERKFVCHYCHEGFLTMEEKLSHEREHLGIPRQSPKIFHESEIFEKAEDLKPFSPAQCTSGDKVIQCDVISEEKLKKIVSYFDKIATGDGSYDFGRLKDKNESCPTVYQKYNTPGCKLGKKRVENVTCNNSQHLGTISKENAIGGAHFSCNHCNKSFYYMNQLASHKDMVHCSNLKSPKYHSTCTLPINKVDGQLNVNSIEQSRSEHSGVKSLQSSRSNVSVDYNASANIVYCNTTSMESLCKKGSVFERFVKKVKSTKSLQSPKWVPAAAESKAVNF